MNQSKLELTDTPMAIMMKMAEGNPGAVTVLIEVYSQAPTTDPQNGLGGLGPILLLDGYGIYGSHIWILYKDHCNSDIRTFILLLRATQMGLFNYNRLIGLAKEEPSVEPLTEVELSELDTELCEELDLFQKPRTA